MIVGIPKEIKNNESRVGMTPAGVFELVKNNHRVYVQSEAGDGSGFFNQDYQQAGAIILDTIGQVYAMSEMIVKVKEPIAEEYDLVAGRMAIQQGAKYLEKPVKGRGVLLGGVPGVAPGKVLVLGAGVVGIQAAKMAAGLGAHVTILDINMKRLRYANDVMPPHVVTEFSSEFNIRRLIKTHDLIIGGVLLKGAKAPNLITRDMLKEMRPGTVIVDVAVDQGGCVETTRPTTHEDPIYIIDDVVHYSVANMPGAVPYTSTVALTNVTLPYAVKLANPGWEAACQKDASLKKGLNIVNGEVVYQEIIEAFGWEEVIA